MSEELTLLPCPACGEKDLSVDEHIYDRYGLISPWWTVICPNCGLSVGEKCKSSPQAIDAWNALPRALTWTDNPPKVPGWYWFKDEYGIRIAWIKHDSRKMNELYAVIGGVGNWMSTLHGQWAGPIPEPREPLNS